MADNETTTVREQTLLARLTLAAETVSRLMFESSGLRNTCVGTSAALLHVLRAQGIEARPVRIRANANSIVLGSDGDGSFRPKTKGWRGHLAVLVEERVLVDATIDQAFRGDISPGPFVGIVPHGFPAGTHLVTTHGGTEVRYRSRERQAGWKSLPAWRPSQWRHEAELALQFISEGGN